MEDLLDYKVTEFMIHKLFQFWVACLNQFTSLFLVRNIQALLNNLAAIFIHSQLLEILQNDQEDLLLSLYWVQEDQDLLDNVIATDIGHHL